MVTACIQASECLWRVSHYSLAASCPAQLLRLSRLQPRRPPSLKVSISFHYLKRWRIVTRLCRQFVCLYTMRNCCFYRLAAVSELRPRSDQCWAYRGNSQFAGKDSKEWYDSRSSWSFDSAVSKSSGCVRLVSVLVWGHSALSTKCCKKSIPVPSHVIALRWDHIFVKSECTEHHVISWY